MTARSQYGSRAVLISAAVTLVLGLGLSGGAAARTQAAAIGVTAPMTAAQETPTPTGDVANARGSFTATLTRTATGASMQWELTFCVLTGPATAAHVHIAPRGDPGPVVVPLCGPCTSPASGTTNITTAVLDAIHNGTAYANVHTGRNRAGEIRGQIGVTASVRTSLSARQSVPRPKGNVRRASGAFTATVTKEGASGTIAWRLTFKRLTGRATAAHIHLGRRGKAGRVIVSLCGPCRNGSRGKATVQASVLNALETGGTYVNIHTRRNKAGEIRGQIAPVPLRISS